MESIDETSKPETTMGHKSGKADILFDVHDKWSKDNLALHVIHCIPREISDRASYDARRFNQFPNAAM